MKIDRIYSPTPIQKKRRIGCWLMVLIFVIIFLTGFWILNIVLLPEREADASLLLTPDAETGLVPWDGYILANITADAPHGPAIFNNLITLSATLSESPIDAERIQSLQQVIMYPRIHGFLKSDANSGQERVLVMLSLKRMSSMVGKLLDQTLTDVPNINGDEPIDPQNEGQFFRLQIKNRTFVSNHEPYLQSLKRGEVINADDGAEEEGAAFLDLHSQISPDGILNGFVINRNGRLKTLAGLLNEFDNDDVYYLVAEGIDLYYPSLWEDAEWLAFHARAVEANKVDWIVSLKIKNRLEAVRAEQFFKDRYFPRLVEGLDGRVLSNVAVEREDYTITLQFSTSLNYIKYVIDSAL